MKQIFKISAIFATTVFAFSCSNDDSLEKITTNEPVVKTFESVLEDGEGASTRAVINSSKKFRWESGDKINVFDNLGGKNQFTAGDPGASNAPSFTGTVTGSPTAFYALYPYDADATWTYGTTTATAYVPSYQGWLTSGNASAAAKLHLLGATESAGILAFKNLTSIIKITAGDGSSLNEIKLEMGSSAAIAGDCNVNLSTRAAGSGSSNTIIMNSTEMAEGDYYFVVLPTTERNIAVTFKTTAGKYQTVNKELKNSSGIEAGKMIDFGTVTSGNLSNLADYNYTKVTGAALSDWTGDYSIVYYDGTAAEDKKYASFGNGGMTRRYYQDADVTGGGTTIAPSKVFTDTKYVTLVKKGSGYYIMNNGKYLTGTNDSNTASFEDSPQAGSIWTPVWDSVNNTMTFTNSTSNSKSFGMTSNGWRFYSSVSGFYMFKADH